MSATTLPSAPGPPAATRTTGRVVAIDRWALRVAAYAGLMRDEYPPFELDR